MFASKRAVDLPPVIDYDCGIHGPDCYGCVFDNVIERTPDTYHSANPILVAYRNDLDGDDPYWSDRLDSYMDWLDWARGDDPYCRAQGITDKHITHARRVLERLARLAS